MKAINFLLSSKSEILILTVALSLVGVVRGDPAPSQPARHYVFFEWAESDPKMRELVKKFEALREEDHRLFIAGKSDSKEGQDVKNRMKATTEEINKYSAELNDKLAKGLIKPPQARNVVPGGVPNVGEFNDPNFAKRNAAKAKRTLFTEVAKNKTAVFVCDASGPMTNKWETLKTQLQGAIGDLSGDQKFNVVFFQGGKALSLSPTLLPATAENMKVAIEFIDKVSVGGNSDPTAALNLAFNLKPEAVYFVAHGDFQDNTAVLKKIRALNAAAKVRFNITAFLTSAERETDFMKVFEPVAKDSNGVYLHLDQSKLDE
jgi:hypothetical protein